MSLTGVRFSRGAALQEIKTIGGQGRLHAGLRLLVKRDALTGPIEPGTVQLGVVKVGLSSLKGENNRPSHVRASSGEGEGELPRSSHRSR